MSYVTKLKKIHFEISNACNASCLGCGRTGDFQAGQEGPLKATHLSLETTARLLQSPEVATVDNILVCGNSGDPMASPLAGDFIALLIKSLPRARISLHTNGSLGQKDTWSRLGQLSQQHPSFIVKFSIDGLEDTNHLYRIGVKFDKIIKNATTFIEKGGQAFWKMVEFPSSKHQVEECRQKSREMGFVGFELRAPYCNKRVPGYDLDLVLEKRKRANPYADYSDEDIATILHKEYSLTDDRRVVCLSKKNQELYVDAYGKVWPCCWIGDSAMPRRSSMDREWFYRTIVKKYGKDFNDLNKKSLTEILNSSWYRGDLIDSTDRNFSDPQNPHQPKCSHKCSVRARPQWATDRAGGAAIQKQDYWK
jgi:sulfatase maturation enzyme AslB (radical SAM superfamily)